MATKGSTPRKGTTSGGWALDRLGGSLDAAQDALKDLRRELSKGGRDLLKDLDALLRDARKNLRRAQRTLV
jgi:ABC-type transporter Mla subunit MlaD